MREIERRLQALERRRSETISPETRAAVAALIEKIRTRELSPEQEAAKQIELETVMETLQRRCEHG